MPPPRVLRRRPGQPELPHVQRPRALPPGLERQLERERVPDLAEVFLET